MNEMLKRRLNRNNLKSVKSLLVVVVSFLLMVCITDFINGRMKRRSTNFRILWWSPYYGHPPKEYAQRYFEYCPVTNCEVVNEKSLLESSDAVIFHGWDVKTEEDLPAQSDRTPNQKWVFFNNEPPSMTQQVHAFNGVFNLTMTYRRDSDVHDPYGRAEELTALEKAEITRDPKLSKINYATGKTRLAAWFVSACDVKSKRHLYVKELERYMKVHIYGKCGNTNETCVKYADECYQFAEKTYKFYFAFENSLCPDYVTEKVFYVMKYNIVPVVLGGSKYSEILPEKSFINVKDFSSPQTLAEYLQKLDTHDELYNEYFEWKNRYKIVVQTLPERMCNLCVYLKDHQGESKTHYLLGHWWDRCFDAEDYYAGMNVLTTS